MLLGKVDVHDGDKEWHFFLLFVFSQTKKGYAKVVLGLLQVDKNISQHYKKNGKTVLETTLIAGLFFNFFPLLMKASFLITYVL